MRVTSDPEVDVLRIELSTAPVEESDEEKPGVILDYDRNGNIVRLEILNASQRVENPRSVDYAVAGCFSVYGIRMDAVMLSEAKHLRPGLQILRCAQDDTASLLGCRRTKERARWCHEERGGVAPRCILDERDRCGGGDMERTK